MTLFPYQETLVTQTAQEIANGCRSVCVQSATGSGKTVIFSAITSRYLSKSPNGRVLILVDRAELLKQTRKTLFNAFRISAQPIVKGMKHIPQASVYLGMVESTYKRLAKLSGITLVIIDEAHMNSFNKIHEAFPAAVILGFTATPLSADKRKPMKMFYQSIVCGPQIQTLITSGALCQNITFAPKDAVNRKLLTIKGGDFDSAIMGAAYSAPKYVLGTVAAYEKYGAIGTKTIIFNASVDHSLKVTEAFQEAGYNCRHVDGTTGDLQRKETFAWFATTPDAILCNVGIATKGFDEPTIETVIVNKATMSMPLWLQMTGRGGRVLDGKQMFRILDFGGNAATHGDWNEDRDWGEIFRNPAKVKEKESVPHSKSCPACDAIIPVSARTCNFCGFVYPAKEELPEGILSDFVIVTRGIDVKKLIDENRDKKEYYPFFKIGKDLAAGARKSMPRLNDEVVNWIVSQCHTLANDWANMKGKKYNAWHREKAVENLYTELEERFKGWERPGGKPEPEKLRVGPHTAPAPAPPSPQRFAIQSIGFNHPGFN